MADIVRRLVWFAIVATAASFAIFVVLGNFAALSASDQGPVPIRDIISSDTHHLSGMILLPLACDELSVQPEQVSPTEYELAFQTWQDPSVPCPAQPTPRTFETVAFAPASGITFIAALDGKGFPIIVIPDASSTQS